MVQARHPSTCSRTGCTCSTYVGTYVKNVPAPHTRRPWRSRVGVVRDRWTRQLGVASNQRPYVNTGAHFRAQCGTNPPWRDRHAGSASVQETEGQLAGIAWQTLYDLSRRSVRGSNPTRQPNIRTPLFLRTPPQLPRARALTSVGAGCGAPRRGARTQWCYVRTNVKTPHVTTTGL